MTNIQGEIYCGVSNSGIKIDFLEKNECTEIISCFWFSSKTKKPTDLKQKKSSTYFKGFCHFSNICSDFPANCKYYRVFPADIAENPLNHAVNICSVLDGPSVN